MKNHQLGELEELVLLVVAVLHDEAYGVSILEHLKENDRRINISAIHVVLRRLEGKGFVQSRYGGITKDRGGRRKKYYTITNYGKQALDEQYMIRSSYYHKIPKIQFN